MPQDLCFSPSSQYFVLWSLNTMQHNVYLLKASSVSKSELFCMAFPAIHRGETPENFTTVTYAFFSPTHLRGLRVGVISTVWIIKKQRLTHPSSVVQTKYPRLTFWRIRIIRDVTYFTASDLSRSTHYPIPQTAEVDFLRKWRKSNS